MQPACACHQPEQPPRPCQLHQFVAHLCNGPVSGPARLRPGGCLRTFIRLAIRSHAQELLRPTAHLVCLPLRTAACAPSATTTLRRPPSAVFKGGPASTPPTRTPGVALRCGPAAAARPRGARGWGRRRCRRARRASYGRWPATRLQRWSGQSSAAPGCPRTPAQRCCCCWVTGPDPSEQLLLCLPNYMQWYSNRGKKPVVVTRHCCTAEGHGCELHGAAQRSTATHQTCARASHPNSLG